MKNKKIINRLLSLGIMPNIKGFKYLYEAVEIVIEECNIMPALTKELYPEIAAKYNDTWQNVERAIRHAISKCKDDELRLKTSGEFISLLALELGM